MKRKSDLSLRIGMVMMLLCAALVLAVLPAAADYDADKPLTEYEKGTVTGGMDYTIGNSTYSSKIWNHNPTTGTIDSYFAALTPSLPTGATNHSSRLYVYYTYSFNNTSSAGSNDIGVEPTMTVTIDGTVVTTTPDKYIDWKNDATAGTSTTTYNYPSGTYAYDVTNYVNSGDPTKTYVVNVTNTKPYNGNDPGTSGDDAESFNIQAVGLLVLYNSSSGSQKNYWIEEGNDLLYTNYKNGAWDNGITPSVATSSATFSDVDQNVSSATLITVAPSAGPNPLGSTVYNRLFINSNNIGGVWDGNPRDYNFSWETMEARSYLTDGDNVVEFRDGVDDTTYTTDGQMQAANAFLLTTA